MKKIYVLIILISCLVPSWGIGQCATATTVPYLEDFEGITQTNEYPPCWTASSPSVTCLTFTTGGAYSGSKMAGFYYSPGGTNHFYSRLIHLNAGVTYSASVKCKTSGIGSSISWSNLSLAFGPNQSTVGLTTIASISGNVVLSTYSSLTNTFVVSSSGDYYLAVNATSNNSGSDFYLYFDQLLVMVPCGVGNNSPTVSIVASPNPACTSDIITYTVAGADYYSTNTGTSAATVYTMNFPAISGLTVVGTSTLTGCSALATVILTINPTPIVIAYGSKPAICVGQSVILMTAGNAANFVWSYNQTIAPSIVVSPTVTTIYTVTGVNTSGCSAQAVYTVIVNPLPNFTLTTDQPANKVCMGKPVVLTGSSGLTYEWLSSLGGFLNGNPITVILNTQSPVTYTTTGTDLNGCKSTQLLTLTPIDCISGIKTNSADFQPLVYPNPFRDEFTFNSGTVQTKKIQILDMCGRRIQCFESDEMEVHIDIRHFENGLYYMSVEGGNTLNVFRLVKN